ncbi:hypothetical protein DF22_001665 [Xylella fastidiosa]|nr:hypothetical protein DF22_001665 [Xylella fastidiosa]
MPFINEIPSAEDIEKYGLPFKKDLDLDISLRSQWTVDRERNFHLYGGGGLQEIQRMKMLFIIVSICI